MSGQLWRHGRRSFPGPAARNLILPSPFNSNKAPSTQTPKNQTQHTTSSEISSTPRHSHYCACFPVARPSPPLAAHDRPSRSLIPSPIAYSFRQDKLSNVACPSPQQTIATRISCTSTHTTRDGDCCLAAKPSLRCCPRQTAPSLSHRVSRCLPSQHVQDRPAIWLLRHTPSQSPTSPSPLRLSRLPRTYPYPAMAAMAPLPSNGRYLRPPTPSPRTYRPRNIVQGCQRWA